MDRLIAWLAIVLTAAAVSLAAPAPAQATYPGADGRIAFVRANQIYTIAAAGGATTQLTTSGKNYRPEWSPDGTKIAYVNETAAGVQNVWIMNANGSGKVKVTSVGRVAQGPTWGPTGGRVAFIVGGDDQRLVWVRSTTPYGAPRAFLGYTTGNPWDEDEDPSVRHEIYGNERDMRGALSWSADNRISFIGAYDSQLDWSFQIYDVGTKENHEEFASGGECCGFTRWTDHFWGPTNQLGYTEEDFDFDTGDYFPSSIVYPPQPGPEVENGDKSGAPSPTGTRLAVVNSNNGTARIFIQNVNRTGRRLLTQGYQPDWQAR